MKSFLQHVDNCVYPSIKVYKKLKTAISFPSSGKRENKNSIRLVPIGNIEYEALSRFQ